MTDLTQPGAFTLEYATSPESTAIVSVRDTYASSSAVPGQPPAGRPLPDDQPGHRGGTREVAEAGPSRHRPGRQRRPQGVRDGSWRDCPRRERGFMNKLADLIAGRIDEFADLETLDNGKPISESPQRRPAPGDRTSSTTRAGPTRSTATPVRATSPASRSGVVGQIIPWNFPMLMVAWKWGPALAAGNTVVLKPAEQTPLTALRLGELAMEAGFRRGVINIVTGFGRRPGRRSSGTRGSTRSPSPARPTRQADHERRGRHPQARDPGARRQGANIVFADADLDEAVEGIVNGIFFNQGQSAARAAASSCRSRSPTSSSTGCAPGWTPPGGGSAGQEHRRRRHQLPEATGQDPGAGGLGGGRGGRDLPARLRRCPTRASSTPRRSSPGCPSPTGSPGRRSSGRCSRS